MNPCLGQDYLCSHPAHKGIFGEFAENFGALHEISTVKLRRVPLARVSQQSTWFPSNGCGDLLMLDSPLIRIRWK